MSNPAARWFLVVFLLALAGMRLWFLPLQELSPDESYYALWAQHLDLGYYSKGPGVAVAIWLGTQLFGFGEFGVRFLSPLLSLGTSLCIWLLARRMFNESVAFWTVLTGSCMPIFWVGSLVMTIDPLSIFFWSAALLTLWLAFEAAPRFSLWWLVSGLLIGLGFLCKYTNAFQLLSVVLLFALSRRIRRHTLATGVWLLPLGFAATAWPPVLWNMENQWITLTHLKARGGLDGAFALRPSELFEFIGVHFGVYSPLILVGISIATVVAWKLAKRDLKLRFLLVFSLPLIGMYLILSLKDAGEANWTAPAFVSLTLLAVAFWLQRARESRTAGVFCACSLVVGVLMSLAMLNTDLVRATGIEWAYKRDPSGRLRGWISAADTVQQFRSALEKEFEEPVFMIANRYQTAAALGFYLPDKRKESADAPPVFIPESQSIENQFSFWPRYDAFEELAPDAPAPDPMFTEQRAVNLFEGRNALFVTDNTEGLPPSQIVRGFEKVELAGEFDVFRRGLFVKRWRVFLCWNYKTLPL